MSITTAHKFFVFIVAVLLIFSCWYKFSIPILAQQVTRTIPAPGFTTITSTSPPINTASYPAPAINPGEKVIGVFAFIHDGGTSWSFTPTVRFKDGSEGNLIVGCKSNSDQGKYGRGLYDVCTGNTDPATKHYSVLNAGEQRQIDSVKFFFDNGSPGGSERLVFEKLEWLVVVDPNSSQPTPTPNVPPAGPCTITGKRYVQEASFASREFRWQDHNSVATAAKVSYSAPSVAANERVIGADIIFDDDGADWDYKIQGNLKNGGTFGTYDFTGPCDQFSPQLGADWEDACSGKTNPSTGKVDSHELVLKNADNPIKNIDVYFGTQKPKGELDYSGFYWIIGTCSGTPTPIPSQPITPPPSVTPPPTPTPNPENVCVAKDIKYVQDQGFSERNIGSSGTKVIYNAPAVPITQRVVGVNVVMNDSGENWAYNPTINLNNGVKIKKDGFSNPCLRFDDNVKGLGSGWIDVCTKQAHPVTGRIDSHELKLNNLELQVQSIELEFSKVRGGGQVRLYGLEWIIADCEDNAVGECKVIPSVINAATSIKSGEKRISAVDKYRLSWTKPEIGNTECAFVNTEVYFTQKSAEGACNYPASPLATINDINQTELEINDFEKYKSYLLNWNRDYCWKVVNNVQKLKVIEVVSNSQTKLRKHSSDSALQIPYWLKYDGVLDSSAEWTNAYTVFDNSWSICSVASQAWRPTGADPNIPAGCFNVNTNIFMTPNGDENIFPRIIQSSSDVNRPYNDRDAFRRKFTIPANITVGKLTLYSAADSVASYWINEKPVNNTGGNLINNRECARSTDAGSYRGVYKLDLSAGLVNPGNNILAGSFVNADDCGRPSPMGLQFILKVEYADMADTTTQNKIESANFTFSTNKSPVFLRNGFTFDGNFKKDTAIEAEIPVGTIKCGFNTGCSIYPSATAPVCFSGNIKSEKADNPVTFWFEYKDPDNDSTVNENLKHYLVLTKASDKIDNKTNLSDFPGGILHAQDRDVVIEYDLNNIALRGEQASKIKVHGFGKFEEPTTKAIRVYYTIEFLEGFETNIYNVHAMFESLAQGVSSTAILADNMDWNKLNLSPQLWTDSRLFTQRGAWGVDLEIPEVVPPEIIVSGVNEFGVNWEVKESGEIGEVMLGCYTNQNPIGLDYTAPDSPFSINVTGKKENPTQCVSDNDKTTFIGLLNDKNPDNNKYSSRYLIKDYKKFGDLGTIISATDRACNVSDPKTKEATKVQDNWFTTRQGTVFLEKGLTTDKVIDKLGDERQEKTYFTYDFSGNEQKLYEKGLNDLTNLSTNFLGINTGGLKGNTSLTREEITGFKDTNDVPMVQNLPPEIDSWIKYFEYVQNQKGRKTVSSPGNPVNDISKLVCGQNEICIYNNLKLEAGNGKNVCDSAKVVFVKGKLTIADELLNKDENSACLFVVDGDVEIQSTKPKKDKEGIKLSPYDVVEGYFILNGKFGIKEDQDLAGAGKGYGDGVFLRGGVVAGDFENLRNLGIRNTIQPPSLMVYDPRYLYLLRNDISARIIQVRETDFNSDTTLP